MRERRVRAYDRRGAHKTVQHSRLTNYMPVGMANTSVREDTSTGYRSSVLLRSLRRKRGVGRGTSGDCGGYVARRAVSVVLLQHSTRSHARRADCTNGITLIQHRGGYGMYGAHGRRQRMLRRLRPAPVCRSKCHTIVRDQRRCWRRPAENHYKQRKRLNRWLRATLQKKWR